MTMTPIFDALWTQTRQEQQRPGPTATRFSVETVWVLTLAEQEAVALGHARMGAEHLLLALVRAGAWVGGVLGDRGVTLSRARRAVSSTAPGVGDDDGSGWSEAAGAVLDAARRRAGHRERGEASPVDVATELIRTDDVATLLTDLGVHTDELAAALERPAPAAA